MNEFWSQGKCGVVWKSTHNIANGKWKTTLYILCVDEQNVIDYLNSTIKVKELVFYLINLQCILNVFCAQIQ